MHNENNIKDAYEENVAYQIEIINEIQKSCQKENSLFKVETPLYYTGQNNWQPSELMTIEDFCAKIDTQRPNFFAEQQRDGRVNQSATCLEELSEQDRNHILKLEQEYTRKMYLSSDSV